MRQAKARARKLESHLLAHRLLVLPISSIALPVPVSRLSNEPTWSVWLFAAPSLRWTEVDERERGLENCTERPDLRPTSCTAIGCAPRHCCLPPATRQQGGHHHHAIRPCAGAPLANSYAPSRIFNVQTGCCKPNCFGPSRRRASNHRSENTPSRRIPRLARRQPASSCPPQPARPTPTPTSTCLMQRPSQCPRQRPSTTITPSARTPRCSIWDVASVMTLQGFHSPGSRPPTAKRQPNMHRQPRPINASPRHTARLQKQDQHRPAFTHTGTLPA